MHEADTARGGGTLEALRGEFELQSWSHAAAGPIFERPEMVVTWQRINYFQVVSLIKIGEGLIAACPSYVEEARTAHALYIPGSVHEAAYRLPPNARIYVSEHNPGVQEFVHELQTYLGAEESSSVEWHGSTALSGEAANIAAHFVAGALPSPEGGSRATATTKNVFLLYLNRLTFVGEAGTKLAHEVASVMANGEIELQLVHENDESLDGCTFAHLFTTTPQELLADGIYAKIAITCLPPPFRTVSHALVVKALGARKVRKSMHAIKLMDKVLPSQAQHDRARVSRHEEAPPKGGGASNADVESRLGPEARGELSRTAVEPLSPTDKADPTNDLHLAVADHDS